MALVKANFLRELLTMLPRFRCAFAYGSGVFQQTGGSPAAVDQADASEKMIDFIVVTDRTLDWHRENLQRNYQHYSALKYLGPEAIAQVQQHFGAQCYFNTLVRHERGLLKYGVVSGEHFVNDLLDWNHLYLAGRLQKPVEYIRGQRDGEDHGDPLIEEAIKMNRQSATHAALLLLDEVFTAEQLFMALVGLSYEGDFRMQFGEDRRKLDKIVQGQFDQLAEIYEPYLQQLCRSEILYRNAASGRYQQEHSPSCVFHHLNLLPKQVQTALYKDFNRTGKLFDIDDVMLSLAHSHQCADYVRKALRGIVRRSSWGQSAKGVLSAGLVRSTKYAMQKLLKMRRSLKEGPET